MRPSQQIAPVKVALVVQRLAEATGLPASALAAEVIQRRGDQLRLRGQEYVAYLEAMAGMDGSEAVIRSRESEAVVFQAALRQGRRVRLVLRHAVGSEDFGDQQAGELWTYLQQMTGRMAMGANPSDENFPGGPLITPALNWLMLDVEPLPQFRWQEHASNLRALRIRRACASVAFMLRQQTDDPELFAATLASGLVEVRRLQPIDPEDLYLRAKE